ncbi:hypothetical protein CVT24_002375 [Panaeolus cyanescens]|uniref:Uncharacterized protein n=1 Tax=Panaeolus cyanescens TaxID=181874 RepID=A0A409WJY7_9AGAR|nr:hypothetical protein CVT24_002375 [Panaeolus cyanescens]
MVHPSLSLIPSSPSSRKYLGLLIVSVGLYQTPRLLRFAFPTSSYPSVSPSHPTDTSSADMSFVGRLINGLLNLFDKDRPCQQLHQRANKLSNTDESVPAEKRALRLKKSLDLYAEALEICRPQNPNKYDLHADYLLALRAKFNEEHSRQYIDDAITQARAAESCWPASKMRSDEYGDFQTNLGNIYLDRYLAYKEESDLKCALQAGESALKSCPLSTPEKRIYVLLLLGRAAHIQFNAMSSPSPSYLTQSIGYLQEAVSLSVEGKHLRGLCYYNLAIAHNFRYESAKDLADLDKAISDGDEADVLLEGHPDRAPCLVNLAKACITKYNLEARKKSYKDESVTPHLVKAQKTLDRASQIGNTDVKQECAKLRKEISSFERKNTTKVLSGSPRREYPSDSIPMPAIPKSEEPESVIPDSAIGEEPPFPLHVGLGSPTT